MASPFSIFRRNQKFMLAALTILAMFGFVFLPILGDSLGLRSDGPVNKTVVTSKYGELRESDVSALLQEHRRILGVLTDVRQMSGEYPLLARQRAEAILGPATEEQVINAWLLARYAQHLGMVVTKEQINAFLKRWTRDVVKPAEFQAVFKRAGLSELQFFGLMRDELLARQMRAMFYVSLEGMTPAERWDYFKRVKQMATVEALPVPVDNYLGRIDEPTDEQLKTFFEDHREAYPAPDSPEPGFHDPQRIALQWFKANQEQFVAQVTDDEVKQRYEKNKELYDSSEKKPEEKQTEQETKEGPSAKNAKDAKDAKTTDAKGDQKSEKADKQKESKPAKPELADATKKRIRREIATERILKIFENLRGQMDQYRSAWSQHEVAVIQEQSKDADKRGKTVLPPAPPKPNFEQLAKDNKLATGQAPLMAQWEAQSRPIGASLVGGRDPVWHYAFGSLARFRPETATDLEGDFYLFWKTEETKDRIPEFDGPGVRERVLKAWKAMHARPLAVKAAESLAAEARKGKQTLKQAFADRPDLKVLTPPAFSWITFGNVPLGSAPGAARISTVPGLEYAGGEFMRTVFRLEPGRIGVAMNAPKTIAYVVRPREFSPSHEVLWKEFEVDDFAKYAPAASDDQQQILRAWIDEIQASAGVEWKRKPDRMMESGPREE